LGQEDPRQDALLGPWFNPDGALAKWEKQKDPLLAGRKVREVSAGVTLEKLCEKYHAAKKDKLSPRTLIDIKATVKLILTTFGRNRLVEDLDVDDFAALRRNMAKRLGPVALHNDIGRGRGVFKFGVDAGLYKHALLFGPGFARPNRKTLRGAEGEAEEALQRGGGSRPGFRRPGGRW
jgi:hypothetical protein